MKFLIVDSYYPSFLDAALPEVFTEEANYATSLDRLLRLRFGTADFYSRNLRELGHEAHDIIFNCVPLQEQWALENGVSIFGTKLRIPNRISRLPLIRRFAQATDTMLGIAIKQIQSIQPDVLYIQDLNLFPPESLQQLRAEGAFRLAVGRIACPLPDWSFLQGLDLILTSFPHYVERFRAQGITSEYFRIAFDPIVLEEIGNFNKSHNCSFVGGISSAHASRLNFLEYLASNVEIDFYGYGAENLKRNSQILKSHHGEAWSLDMYRTLASSRISINFHIDVAENYANNMRLYEATGCGALLITDHKDNIADLFEPDKEVVTYRNSKEALEKITYYLAHPQAAETIARAGQARTLREHTYRHRMVELITIVDNFLAKRSNK